MRQTARHRQASGEALGLLAAEHAEGGGRGSGQRGASAQGAQRQGRALRGRGGGGRDGSLPDSSADGQFLFLPPLCKLSLRI